MENHTPMLRQYREIKKNFSECILFFRLGDFYEMFYEDAKQAARLLNLVLTSRGAGKGGKVPMCGIPFHAAENYIARLIKSGMKVAICEQVEDPAQAKGIVKREVIRVITSGTFIDESDNDSRYIICASMNKNCVGLALTDNSSGIILANQWADPRKILELISKLPVYECVFPRQDEDRLKDIFRHPLVKLNKVVLSPYENWCFNPEIAKKTLINHFNTNSLDGFGMNNLEQAATSAGALLEYLKQTQNQPLKHIDRINIYTESEYMFIPPAAVYGLEMEDLLKTLDHTLTPMGKRKFRHWLFHPLKDCQAITGRLEAVKLLNINKQAQKDLEASLRNMPDLEKSLSRISCGYTHPRDLLSLRAALSRIPRIQKDISSLGGKNDLFIIDDFKEIRETMEAAINPLTPLSNPEGKIINKGFNAELDSLREIRENRNQWLRDFQAGEIKKTGINSLKIGFNKIFGYYIEVSRPNLSLVPSEYIRKQTLVNAERFIIPQLKEFEEKMFSNEDKILKIEQEILSKIRKHIIDNSFSLHQISSQIARIDAIYSLSVVAGKKGYVSPGINDGTEITIKEGRHPVVESSPEISFISNDTLINRSDNHLLVITGPNMAGKSTYIRQTAIIVIMAQMGCFVPAESAAIGIVDKLFTRIGAKDEISKGQSTFMVEMNETAEILNNLSERSLVILDEIGRGTSTFDGLSLAWAVAEYLILKKTRTLFATHFHELTSLAQKHEGVKNYNVLVKEWQDKIIFLHKIVAGGTDESYGIYVAQLAGIPAEVVKRAKHILIELETHGNLKTGLTRRAAKQEQLSLFDGYNKDIIKGLIREMKETDLNHITPLEALNKLCQWKKDLDG